MWLIYTPTRNHLIIKILRFYSPSRFFFSNSNRNNIKINFEQSKKINSIEVYQHLLQQEGVQEYLSDIYLNLAQLHLSAYNSETAITCLIKAIKADPNNKNSYIKLAKILKDNGQISQAITVLEQAIKNVLDCRMITMQLVKMYLQIKDYQKVVKCLSKLTQSSEKEEDQICQLQIWLIYKCFRELNSDNISKMLKDMYIRNNNIDEGIKLLSQMRKVKDTQTINLALSSLFLQSGKLYQAKQIFKHILMLNNSNYHATISLAIIYLQQKQFQESIMLFQQARKINSTDSLPLTSLGLIYLQTHKVQQACRMFKQAIWINQQDTVALSSLGRMQISRNQIEEGINNLKKTLQIDPLNQFAKESLNLVSTILDYRPKK